MNPGGGRRASGRKMLRHGAPVANSARFRLNAPGERLSLMGRSAALVPLVKGRSPVHKTSGIVSRVRGALRLAGAATGKAFVGPRMVGLEVTHFCNLGCGFCETHGRFMALPIVKRRTYVG